MILRQSVARYNDLESSIRAASTFRLARHRVAQPLAELPDHRRIETAAVVTHEHVPVLEGEPIAGKAAHFQHRKAHRVGGQIAWNHEAGHAVVRPRRERATFSHTAIEAAEQ